MVRWLLARSGHDHVAGGMIALMAGVKLWPAFLILWFVAQRRWRAVTAFGVSGAVVGLASVAGAGIDAHLDYLAQVPRIAPTPESLAGITGVVWIGYALLGIVALVVVLACARPGLTFALAVGAVVPCSPVLYVNHLTLLLGAVAPVAWQLPRASVPEAASEPRSATP